MSVLVVVGLVILSLALLGASVLLAVRRRWVAAAVTAIAVLIVVGIVAIEWLGFVYPSKFGAIEATLMPDRQYTLAGTAIPLPPRTITSGSCSGTGRRLLSYSPLTDVTEFYRTAGATVELADQQDKANITYKGIQFEAVAATVGRTQLGIGCHVGEPN